MKTGQLEITEFLPAKISGASPSASRYYVLILFDISNQKKYRKLLKTIQRYGLRMQKSVFEAYLRKSQIKELTSSIESLMASDAWFDSDDVVRIYTIAGNCTAIAFGKCDITFPEENIFI